MSPQSCYRCGNSVENRRRAWYQCSMVDTAPLARILARVRDAEVFDALTGRLSGADLI
jgi:hypothetical protein